MKLIKAILWSVLAVFSWPAVKKYCGKVKDHEP